MRSHFRPSPKQPNICESGKRLRIGERVTNQRISTWLRGSFGEWSLRSSAGLGDARFKKLEEVKKKFLKMFQTEFIGAKDSYRKRWLRRVHTGDRDGLWNDKDIDLGQGQRRT